MLRLRRRAGRTATALVLSLSLAGTSILLSGCGTAGSKLPVSEMTAKTDASGVQVVDIDVHSFYFKPNRIVVESGKPVELVLHFKSLFVPHNLTCVDADAGISIDKSAGFMSFRRTKRARFTPTRPGEYEFFCHVGSHGKKGMRGTIVVR
jgi:plastocyanin